MRRIVILLVALPLVSFGQKDAASYRNDGDRLKTIKEYFRAMQSYNSALKSCDANTDTYFFSLVGRAECKMHLKDYRGTLADADSAINLNPTVALQAFATHLELLIPMTKGMCYSFRGLANYNLGNSEQACWDWSKGGELGFKGVYGFIEEYCQ